MSLVTLEKRLTRVEKEAAAILKPFKPKSSLLLAGVTEDASEAEHQRFAAELKQAQATYDMVIVLQPVKPKLHRQSPGVEFMNNRLEAQLAVATHNPSEHGRANQLDDILDGLAGNVFRPVSCTTQAE